MKTLEKSYSALQPNPKFSFNHETRFKTKELSTRAVGLQPLLSSYLFIYFSFNYNPRFILAFIRCLSKRLVVLGFAKHVY